MGIKSYFGDKTASVKEDLKKIMGVKTLTKNFDYIKEDFNSLILPTKLKESKVEEFYESCLKSKTSLEDLKKIYKNLSLHFFVFSAISLAGFIFGLYNMVVLGNWLYGVSLLAFALLGSSQIFNSSFRAYQIKIRELCKVEDWLVAKDFIPSFVLMSKEEDKILNVLNKSKTK